VEKEKKVMGRRQFFFSSGTGLLAASLLFGTYRMGVLEELFPPSFKGGDLLHPAHVKEIAEEYLKEHPRSKKEDLFFEIFSRKIEISLPEARGVLENKIKEDFIEYRTFEFKGWLLSQTEAQLCTLIYLESLV
jgi:hypothetical protein